MTNSKYGAMPTELDGIRFASKMEARRYAELKLMVDQGMISDLELQPRYPLIVNGTKVCSYVADFRYFDIERERQVVEDVKGAKTRDYRIKVKLLKAIHGIDVVETMA